MCSLNIQLLSNSTKAKYVLGHFFKEYQEYIALESFISQLVSSVPLMSRSPFGSYLFHIFLSQTNFFYLQKTFIPSKIIQYSFPLSSFSLFSLASVFHQLLQQTFSYQHISLILCSIARLKIILMSGIRLNFFSSTFNPNQTFEFNLE